MGIFRGLSTTKVLSMFRRRDVDYPVYIFEPNVTPLRRLELSTLSGSSIINVVGAFETAGGSSIIVPRDSEKNFLIGTTFHIFTIDELETSVEAGFGDPVIIGDDSNFSELLTKTTIEKIGPNLWVKKVIYPTAIPPSSPE